MGQGNQPALSIYDLRYTIYQRRKVVALVKPVEVANFKGA